MICLGFSISICPNYVIMGKLFKILLLQGIVTVGFVLIMVFGGVIILTLMLLIINMNDINLVIILLLLILL